MGVPATGKKLTLRVMDIWRCEAGSIRENWVLLDMVHLFQQMGVDLLPKPEGGRENGEGARNGEGMRGYHASY